MEGSKMLKVVGILMIIFGAIALVVDIIAALGIAALDVLGANVGLLWVSLIVSFIGVVVEFVGGIVGVANWKKPEKANVCVVFGILAIVMWLVSTILTFVAYPGNFSWFSVVTSLVIPVLYLIGAFQNKKLASGSNN